MKDTLIDDISELLDIFSIQDLDSILEEQFQNLSGEIDKQDYFRYITDKFRSIQESDNLLPIKEAARERYILVCELFMKKICDKFGLSYSEDWADNTQLNEFPMLIDTCYHLFMFDLKDNLVEVILNFIENNKSLVDETFSSTTKKKDATSIVSHKDMDKYNATVVSNAYSVAKWVLGQLSEESYIDYLSPDYIYREFFNKKYEDDVIGGRFMDFINEIYTSNLDLQSVVCFELISILRQRPLTQ